MTVACLVLVSAKADPEVQELAKALAAKKESIHGISQAVPNTIHAHTVAQAAAHRKALGDQALQTARASVLTHSPLMALETKPVVKAPGADKSLLTESIDDNKVGDFSKDHNKHDHRMMNGKFDWLLKASSPLYSAAKSVAGSAQHQLAKVLHKNLPAASGSSLQEEGNSTDTSEASGAAADLENVKKENAANETKFLEFSKDKEGYFFFGWIVVLIAFLCFLGLCLFFAKSCLGASDGQQAAASTEPCPKHCTI